MYSSICFFCFGDMNYSSEEGDDGYDQGKKRSYECTFCKRGFTNAQALGGHMNIHRKDRAKASKQPNSSSSQIGTKFYTNDETMVFPFASEQNSFVGNYQPSNMHGYSYEQPRSYEYPTASPNYLVGNYQTSNVHGFSYDYQGPSNWHLNQELQGPDLSLQIGSTHYVDNTHHQRIRRGNDQEENEVDLELRLGQDSRFTS